MQRKIQRLQRRMQRLQWLEQLPGLRAAEAEAEAEAAAAAAAAEAEAEATAAAGAVPDSARSARKGAHKQKIQARLRALGWSRGVRGGSAAPSWLVASDRPHTI